MRDRIQFDYIAGQVYHKDSNGLYESYLDAKRRSHGYLLLDLAQDREDLRLRTKIFSTELTLGYAPIGDETDKVELAPLTRAQISIVLTAKRPPREFVQ